MPEYFKHNYIGTFTLQDKSFSVKTILCQIYAMKMPQPELHPDQA